MARNENLGGFWYSLGIDTDRGSFARAGEAINGLVNTFKTAAAIIGVGFTIKATVQNASEVYLMANKLGEGVQELRKWEASSTVLRANFKGVVDDAINLDDKMKRINRGQWDSGLGTSAAQFGLDFETFRNMGDMERAQTVLERALGLVKEGKMEAQEAAGYVKDIMGGSTADLFLKMLTPNAAKLGLDTVQGMLAYADAHIFNTEKETESLDMLDKQFQTVKTTATSLWTLVFGQMSEKWLEPGTEAINGWLAENKPAIEKKIREAFDEADKAVTKIFNFFKSDDWAKIWDGMKDAWTIAKEAAKWIYDHTIGYEAPPVEVDLTEEEKKGLQKEYSKTFKNSPKAAALDAFSDPAFGDIYMEMWRQALVPEVYNAIKQEYDALVSGYDEAAIKKSYIDKYGEGKGTAKFRADKMAHGRVFMQDGIIKPNGGLVQVDPNDWLLAFKNLGDVAGALIPQGAGGNVANITISQNFTLNGNPMPGQVRDMAYRGTTSAMSELFTRAGAIVQMMPATR